jgi:aryl-alcohol dehydrogenase-like predicted oxidoreductase
VLGGAEKNEIKILTRVIDYGGVFHDDMKPGHIFRPGDHRAYRPEGWVERGCEMIERMRPIADKHGLTMLQFASIWNLSQKPVESVVPTFIQEAGDDARPVEDKIDDLAALPDVVLTADEIEEIRAIGDNTGCMKLKGASKRHDGPCERRDEWPMRDDLLVLADSYGVGRDW